MENLKKVLEGQDESCILPFLWLKGEDNERIREELEKIRECGIREICLEARPHPEFCREGWWENLDFIIEEAKQWGMKVWVLDDKKFPTGYANGAFEEKYPELSKLYIAQRHVDIMGPCRGGASLVENFLPPDGCLLGILACPKPDGETLAVSGEGVLDLTDSFKDGFVFYDLPKGAYRLFVIFTTRTGGGREHYMNLLDQESVKVFLDEVYEKHYERYGEEFGKTFAGFFSDEPEIGNVPGYPFDCLPGQPDIRLPWSKELEKELRNRWGKEFLENLVALWYDRGEKTGEIRVQYMDFVTKLVYRCFSGQVGEWCRKHGVEYIGHIIEDDNAHGRLGCSIGHYFREMKGRQMAGIDVVHHQIVPGFTKKIHQWIAGDSDGEFFHFGLAKLASSSAHLDEEKKGRALCEIFGNYGWAEGVSFMKWLADHMLVRGINRFTPHAFAMSYPDADCPPHFYASGNNPQFPVFTCLMKYMNRAAYLLSGGKPVREAAILYHAESEWSGEETMFFQKPMRVLMENQMDADVVSDDWFDKAIVQNGNLKLGTESYPALILPGCKRLPVRTARFLEQTELDGFPVFIVDFLPEKDTDGNILSENFYRKVQLVNLDSLAEKLSEYIEPLFIADQKFSELRSFALPQEQGLICMFFNESVTEKAELVLHISQRWGSFNKAVRVDLWRNTAETFKIQDQMLPLSLETGEAVFWILEKMDPDDSEGEKNEFPFIPQKKREQILKLEWQVSRRGRLQKEFEPIGTISGENYPNMNGPQGDPGFTGTYRYEGTFSFAKEPEQQSRFLLKIPGAGDTARLFLNGKDLGYMAGFPNHVEVTDILVHGKNMLCMEVTTTLVWERKDGASTHLQISPTGLWEAPVLEEYE